MPFRVRKWTVISWGAEHVELRGAGMGRARDGEGGRVVNDGWRDVRPDEVFEPGRHFRMNQTDGTT
jgi:hypothetical protein